MAEWNVANMIKSTQSRGHSVPQSSAASAAAVEISLDKVSAYDIDMDVGDRKNATRIKLHRVPAFLVEAFARLDTNKAWSTEGVFRKEGNSARMKNAEPIYCGHTAIPKEFTTHDICSLIKRFFRELRPSLFMDKQRNLLKFAETLRDRPQMQPILAMLDALPPSHKATLAYLMRQLHKVSESAAQNQMNVENLAVVFAPTLFRDDAPPSAQANRKKRGSQDSLLNAILSQNELRTAVVKLLIVNSHMLGLPLAGEQPSKPVARKPSDLKRKQVAPTGFDPLGKKTSPRSASENPSRRTAIAQPAPVASKTPAEVKHTSKRTAKKDKEKSRKRSSSVARIFSAISNIYSKPASERRPSTPVNPHTVRAPNRDGPSSSQIAFHTSDEEEPTLMQVSDRLSRVQSPRRPNINAAGAGGRMEWQAPNDARYKKAPASRTPITQVFDINAEGDRVAERKVSTSKQQAHAEAPKPLLAAQKSAAQLTVPALSDNACSLGEEYIKKNSSSQLRAVALQVDRRRRHTAPVKQSGIKRNQPNTLKSGLVDPRARRCNTMVVYNNDENKPVRRRRTQSIDSSNEESPSYEELDLSDPDDVFVTADSSVDSPNTTSNILEQKGMEARRRRAKCRRRKNTGADGLLLSSPDESTPVKDSAAVDMPRQALAVKNLNISQASPPPLPSCPPPEDSLSSVYETPKSSMKSGRSPLLTGNGIGASPPSLDDERTPLATGVQEDHLSAATVRRSPKSSCTEQCPQRTTTPPPRSSYHQQVGEISPKGTRVLVSGGSHTTCTTPKRSLAPATSVPIPPLGAPRHGHGRLTSRSPPRLPCTRMGERGSPNGFSGSSERLKEIMSAKSSKELHKKSQLPDCARPSLAFLQKQNRGFVQQRIHQFANLESNGHDAYGRSTISFGSVNGDGWDSVKPIAPPASHSIQSRVGPTAAFKRSNGTSALHGRSPAARVGSPSRNALTNSTSAGMLPRRDHSSPRTNPTLASRRNAVSAADLQRKRTSVSENERC